MDVTSAFIIGQMHESQRSNNATEDQDNLKEEMLHLAALGLVIAAFLVLVLCTIPIIYAKYADQQTGIKKPEIDKDLPPTYSQIVLRKEPPEYHESIMQEINPESNPDWSPEVLHKEVKDTVATKVRSQAHGMHSKMIGRASSSVCNMSGLVAEETGLNGCVETTADAAASSAVSLRGISHALFVV